MHIADHLATLEQSDLIRVAQIEPDLEYLFRHAMMQDVTYSSLLRKDRRELHRRVAQTLEAAYPNRRDELASTLARHFDEAGDAPHAFEYHLIAADRSAAQFANTEAITHYARALAISADAVASSDAVRRLYMRYGRVLEIANQYAEALALYRQAETEGARRTDPRLELEALSARATIQCTPNPYFNPPEGQQAIERALSIAESLDDQPVQAKLLWNLMLLHLYSAGEENGRKSLEAGERSLAICRQHPELVEQTAYTLNDIFGAYIRADRVDEALAVINEARESWQQLGNIPMLTDSLSSMAVALFRKGDYDRVLAVSDEGFEAAAAINHGWGQASTRQFASYALFDMGDISASMEMDEIAIQLADQTGYPGNIILRHSLGMRLGQLGQVERGLSLALIALEGTQHGLDFMTALPLASIVRLQVLKGDLPAAEHHMEWLWQKDIGRISYFNMSILLLQAAAELAYAQGDTPAALTHADLQIARLVESSTLPFHPDAYLIKGRILRQMNRLPEAETALREGIQIADSLGSKWNGWRLRAALAHVFDTQGRSEEAAAARREASTLIDYIAARIDDAELCASFLALPDIQPCKG